MANKMRKIIISYGILIVLVNIGFIMAQVPTFHQFHGRILDVNGSFINVTGLGINAYVNGTLVESVGSTGGLYGYSNLFFVENRVDGEIIEFYTHNYPVANLTVEDVYKLIREGKIFDNKRKLRNC